MQVQNDQGGAETPTLTLSPEEEASVAKAKEGLTETNPNVIPDNRPQRPEHIPEKFWDAEKGEANVEALAKSYAELERQRTAQPKVEEPAAKEPSKDGKITKDGGEEAPAENPLQSLMTKASEEYSSSREVSEDTVKALAEAGIPPEIMNNYLAGLAALEKQQMAQVHGYTDGAENYSAMSDWAAKNLSDTELEAYNAALDDAQLRETAVRGLYARYQAAVPSEGSLRGPNGGGDSSGGDTYSDRSELIKDQSDPRYQTDPSFRKQVMEKLARSQRSGFQLNAQSMFQRTIINS